jgi:hypothetical protein
MFEQGMGSIWGVPLIVHAVLFACVFWLAAAALGRRLILLFRLHTKDATQLESSLIAMVIGTGFLQLLPYLLASVGAMTAAAVRISCLLLLLLLLPDVIRVLVEMYLSVRASLETKLTIVSKAWAAILCIIFAIFLIHALAFGPFGDDDGYHLSAPARWLHEHTLAYLPSYTNTNTTMGVEMLYVIALSFGEPVGAKLLHFGAGLWMLLATVLCGRRLGDVMAGIITISVLLITTPVVNLSYIFPLAYVDLLSCWAAMMSVLAWLIWRQHPSPSLLSIVALCSGIAVSFKLTNAPLIIAWMCAITLDLWLRGVSWRETFKQLIKFSVIAGAPISLWFLRNFLVTGNPLYPLLPGLIETRDWSVEQGEIFSRYTRYYAWGVASGAQLGETARKALVMLTALLVTATAGLLASRIRDTTLRIMLALAATYTVLSVLLTGLVFRYWLFGIICFILVGVVILDKLVRDVNRRSVVALAMISIALLVQVRIERRGSQRLITDLSIATGVRTPEQAHADDPLWQFWGKVRELTPADARILVSAFYTTFGASSFQCFLIDRQCYTTDSHLQRFIRLDTWPAFLQSVQSAGIQYVLISNQNAVSNRHGFAFTEGINEYPFCSRLVAEYGQVIAKGDALLLYRIRTLNPS